MKISTKNFFLAICFLISTPPWLHAQPRSVSFKRYTAADGLESSHINCLLQDHRGFLWVGTGSGLYRFDGYTFKAFRRDPADTTSISDNIIWTLYEDRFKTLWAGTSSGLNAFDHRTEKFAHYRNDQEADSTAANFIRALWEDAHGTLWVKTHGGGVYQLNRTTRRFTRTALNFPNPVKPGGPEVSTIIGDRDSTLWIGTHKGGFARMSADKKHLTTIPIAGSDRQHFSIIGSIVEDAEGILWLGTSGAGLIAYDPQTGHYEIFKSDPSHPLTLSDDWITSQYVDRAGNLWIGTRSGLNKLQSPRKKIGHLKKILDDPNSLINNNVNAIWEDRQGKLWVGTAGGLSVFDANSKLIANYKNDPKDEKSLSLNFVQALGEDKNGDIWVGTFGRGLNKYNRQNGTFTRFRHDSSDTGSLSQNFVTAIYEDRSGDLWIGTLGGLNKLVSSTGSGQVPSSAETLDRRENRFIRYLANAKNPKALSHNGITWLLEDRSHRLWIGTYGGGLNLLNRATGEFTHYLSDPANPHSLRDNIIYCIFEDANGLLWIGTNNGLDKFDPATGRFSHYLQQDGLPNDVVLGILGDGEGNLWISTHNGLCKFDDRLPAGQKFVNFDAVANGLQGNEFNTGAFHQNRAGELFFGGTNGLNRFYPQDLKAKSPAPAIVITAFNKFNKAVVLDTAISMRTELKLSYDDIFFSFEFSALDFTLSEKNEYAYKMESFNNDWIFCGNQHYATFTSLEPGSYIFKVKGANSDGVWNEAGAALRLTITPPFWQTWWFRAAAAGSLLLLAYGLYRLRLAKAIDLERLRVRIASDLHDDIGASLTKISLYSDLIQTDSDAATAKDLLRKIGVLSRELVTTMSDVVWSIDARNDTMGNLLDRMRDFATGVLSVSATKIDFKCAGLDMQKKLPVDFRQNIYLIFKEAINNIAKHAEAGRVDVQIHNDAAAFNLIIRDDGKGWREHEFAKLSGHGLRNMKMRASRLGGNLNISRNGGCTVSVTAPVLR